MKNSLLALVMCSLAACATYDPNADGAAYRDNQVATGSNIPRKGTAAVMDRSAVSDASLRTVGGIRPGGGGNN